MSLYYDTLCKVSRNTLWKIVGYGRFCGMTRKTQFLVLGIEIFQPALAAWWAEIYPSSRGTRRSL